MLVSNLEFEVFKRGVSLEPPSQWVVAVRSVMDEILLSTLEAYHIALCRAFDLLDAFAFFNLGDYSPCDSLIVFTHCSRLW